VSGTSAASVSPLASSVVSSAAVLPCASVDCVASVAASVRVASSALVSAAPAAAVSSAVMRFSCRGRLLGFGLVGLLLGDLLGGQELVLHPPVVGERNGPQFVGEAAHEVMPPHRVERPRVAGEGAHGVHAGRFDQVGDDPAAPLVGKQPPEVTGPLLEAQLLPPVATAAHSAPLRACSTLPSCGTVSPAAFSASAPCLSAGAMAAACSICWRCAAASRIAATSSSSRTMPGGTPRAAPSSSI